MVSNSNVIVTKLLMRKNYNKAATGLTDIFDTTNANRHKNTILSVCLARGVMAPTSLSRLQFIGVAPFSLSCSLSPPFSFPHTLTFLSLSLPPSQPVSSLSALMQQSRKRTHLSGLMAAGGVLCTGRGAWLAWMRGFRRLPCCKVIVIKSWLTVVDCAFEVQMSFPSILKSPFRHHLLMRSYKKSLNPHQILGSVCEY